jgi:hypothetical protein
MPIKAALADIDRGRSSLKLTSVEMVATDRIDDAMERYLGPLGAVAAQTRATCWSRLNNRSSRGKLNSMDWSTFHARQLIKSSHKA